MSTSTTVRGYRNVGYGPDRGTRKDPSSDGPTGYNEQTLFRGRNGDPVSIISGRENLGRVPGSPRDTWFFRSASADEGESWSRPDATNPAGTGATGAGLTLPDGTLLIACPTRGRTWMVERLVQRDPDGRPFKNHYNAMNGQFITLSEREVLHVFGHFVVGEKPHRVLALELGVG